MSETDTVAVSEEKITYKLSLAQWSYNVPINNGTMDPLDFAEYAKTLGFTGLEYVNQLYKLDSTVSHREAIMNLVKMWKEKSDAFGMENVLIMIDHEGELADPSAEKRAEAIENHKAWVDAAQYIGAHSIRVNLFGISEPNEWHQVSVASLIQLATYAATKNINVIVENHGGFSSHGEKLAAVMKEVNMANCGTLPDFGNFCVARRDGDRWGSPCIDEYDMYKGISEMMPWAKGVSAKSHEFDEKGNETVIDYYRMLQIVKDSGFSGYIGVEYEGSLPNPEDGIMLTKELLNKAISQIK